MAVGRNPAGAVTSGSASIPAPTVLPVMSAIAPNNVPAGCECECGCNDDDDEFTEQSLLVLRSIEEMLLSASDDELIRAGDCRANTCVVKDLGLRRCGGG